MPEAERREVDKMLRGLAPKHQRQLSVSSSNALERFAVMEAVLQHRKLVLLLDYDGTLTPIVKDPSKALLSDRVRAILRELPKHFITGVISGRSLGKIRAFVDVKGLFYAGSHGFDILAPSHSVYSGSLGLKRVATPPRAEHPASSCSSSSPPPPPPSSSSSSSSSTTTPSPPPCCSGKNVDGTPAGAVDSKEEDRAGKNKQDTAVSSSSAGGCGTATTTNTNGGNGAVTSSSRGEGGSGSSGSSGDSTGKVTAGVEAVALSSTPGTGGSGSSGSEGGSSEEMDASGSGALEEVRHQVAQEYLPVMAKIRDQLIDELKGIDKSEVEDNRFSVSIHYRNCARVDVPRVREVVERVQSRHERIRMGSGKEVFELQPDIAWDKGKAVLWLLDKLVLPMAQAASADGGEEKSSSADAATAAADTNGAAAAAAAAAGGGGGGGEGAAATGESVGQGGEDEDDDDEEGSGRFFTIFIGDDKTDENAFRVLNGDMGEGRTRHDGVGILVSEESRETNAAYTLRNPDEVASFLEKIAELGSERCRSSTLVR